MGLWYYKEVQHKSFSDWATNMLIAGYSSTNLGNLAGIEETYPDEKLFDLVQLVFDELELDYSNGSILLKYYCLITINEINNHTIPLSEGLFKLYQISLEDDLSENTIDFYNLFHAYEGLGDDSVQWYWNGANKDNIDVICYEYFQNWINNNIHRSMDNKPIYMYLERAKANFKRLEILHSEEPFIDYPSVIAYEKKFRFRWMATQLNTFIVVSDFGDKQIGVEEIEYHLNNAFNYTKKHYTGWPRGLQSGIGVISILISSNLTGDAKEYCRALRSVKKWAGFTIPVVVDSTENKVHQFVSSPMWGAIYYPHFKKLIKETLA